MGYTSSPAETPIQQADVARTRADVDNGDNTGAVRDGPEHDFGDLEGQMAPTHGYSSQKDNYAKRLRRIEGQVRGIAKMIEDDKYCIDVLTQISAANNALQSVALNLLDEHLGHCVTHAVAQGGTEAEQKLAEASAAIARLVRS
jgi:CsoR family transcriptional regulator, copper-sensing transcriptional repressor